ncbi:D-hexose-6-phosphate mutarotase [uncultured Gilliamella sp.]|uniref:D-hexose-6-phosphate mutarotase n=1 Tax=uncultured Gilliamella sp. TaxID=1193505 RepID=UPI002601294E|nr:D-hexose-6-phosphate mutarotase [uncultured Gilliamella sp.]
MSIFKDILNNSVSEKSISPSVQQTTFGELPILVIKHKICSAAVSLQGAHLLFWQPITESTPVIWLSQKAIFKHGKAIRGGVPVCWPWFGKLGDPMHGFARIVDWTLDSCKEDENGVELVLSLTNNQQTQAFFTKPFNVWLTIHLGKTCQITLSCQGDFEATSALHTYFGVNNIANVVVKGLGKTYEERLAVVNKPAIEGQLTFNQEVDRIYNNANKIITISDGDRTIQLTNTEASDVVTWNPWIDKAKSMADFADEEYQSMVCVETACINKPLKLSMMQKTTYGFKIELV